MENEVLSEEERINNHTSKLSKLETKEELYSFFEELDTFSYTGSYIARFDYRMARSLRKKFAGFKTEEVLEFAKPILEKKDTYSYNTISYFLHRWFFPERSSIDDNFKLPASLYDKDSMIKLDEDIKFCLQHVNKESPLWKKVILDALATSQDVEQTKFLLPYIDVDSIEAQEVLFFSFLQAKDNEQVKLILPMLNLKDRKQQSLITIVPKDELQYWEQDELESKVLQSWVAKVHSEEALAYFVQSGAKIDETVMISLLENGMFHDEFERKIDNPDNEGNITLETKFGNIKINEYEAKMAYGEYYQRIFEINPACMSIEEVYKAVKYFDCYDEGHLAHATHTMCHAFERGLMVDAEARVRGNIVLDKILSMHDMGKELMNDDRCFDGYWWTVKDERSRNREEQAQEIAEDFREVLEKYPHNPMCRKYINYLNGEKEKDLSELRKEYLQDKEMLFVDTIMVDVDGTLLNGKGKLNLPLILKLGSEDFEIFTGGDPKKQRAILLRACVAFEEEMKLLPADDTSQRSVEAVKLFKSKLMNGLPIYSKAAFMQDNVCLAKGVYDDTLPENQGIKSLVSYGELGYSAYNVYNAYNELPIERKVSAKQVFDMYIEKQKIHEKIDTLKGKVSGDVEETLETTKTSTVQNSTSGNVKDTRDM